LKNNLFLKFYFLKKLFFTKKKLLSSFQPAGLNTVAEMLEKHQIWLVE